MADEAVFNDVLQVTVDTTTFKQGLDELRQLYQKFIQDIGEAGATGLGLFSLSQQISEFQEQFKIVSAEITDIASNMAASQEASVLHTSEVEQAVSEQRRERAKKDAEEVVKDYEDAEQAKVDALQRAQFKTDAILAQRAAAEESSPQGKLDVLTSRLDVVKAAEANLDADNEDLSVVRFLNTVLSEEVSLLNKINSITKQLEETDSSRLEQAKERTQQLLSQLSAAQATDAADKVNSLSGRLAVVQASREALDVDSEDVSVIRQINTLLSEEVSLTNRISSLTKQQEDSHGNILGSLGTMVKRITEIYVIWNAVQGAVNGIVAVLKSPITFFEDGSKYLDTIEQTSERLTGVLNANVKYSDDLNKNLQIASQVSKQVAVELNDVAARTGVSFESLTKTFSAFVDAGGIRFTQNAKEMVQVVEEMTLALQATGRGSENVRSVVSQLPLFLNGSVKATSALAEAFGLTARQMEDLRDRALEHRDLLGELAPILSPYLSALELAKADHVRLVAQLEDEKDKLEAAYAGPLRAQIDSTLKSMLTWLQEHSQELQRIAQTFGKVVAFCLNVADALSDWKTPLVFAVEQISKMALMGGVFLTTLGKVPSLLKDAATALINPQKGIADAAKDFLPVLDKYHEALKISKELGDELTSRAFPRVGAGSEAALNLPGGQKRDYANTENVKGTGALDFREAIAEIQNEAEQQKDFVKNSVQAGAITKTLAASLIQGINDAELQALQQAAEDAKQHVGGPNDTAAQVAAAKKAIDIQIQRFTTSLQKEDSTASGQGIQEQLNNKKTLFNAALQVERNFRQSELQLQQEYAKEGYSTDLQVADQRLAILKQEHEATVGELQQELSQFAVGTNGYTAVLAKILVENQNYSSQSKLLSEQRAALLESEIARLNEYRLTVQQLADDQAIAFAHLTESVADYAHVIQQEFTLRAQEIQAQEQEIERQLQLAAAKGEETKQTEALTLKLASLRQERIANLQAQISSIRSNIPDRLVQQVEIRSAVETEAGRGKQPGETDQQFSDRLQKLNDVLQRNTPSIDNALDNLQHKFFGFDLSEALSKAQSASDKFAIGLEAGANALANLKGIVSNIQNGIKQGGVLGGIGAGISSVSGALSEIPVVGQFIPAIGGVLSFIGNMFTQAAKNIADEVKKQFQQTLDNYQEGNSTLVQTLTTIEQERNDAIVQLSGKKGGKDQLDQLLPEFDKEISQLKNQQQDIITNFDQSLSELQLHSDALSQINQQWTQINKSVKDYIGAGGDAVKAAQYLSLELEQIKESAQDELTQGEQQSIQDAIQLNGLLTQRNQLEEQYKQQVFDLANQDSIERRQAGVVTRAEQIQQLSEQYQQQLGDINSQIELQGKKVDAEKQVFTIANSIADLHDQDNKLQLEALDKQIAKWKDLKTIVAGISLGPNGLFQAAAGLFSATQTFQINVSVQPPQGANPTQVGQQVADSLSQAMQRQFRMVPVAP